MYQSNSYSGSSKLDKAMTTEQFEQIVDSILAGKYSWACVLILRFAGYNPLHYIPYRTYNRLLKDNIQSKSQLPPSNLNSQVTQARSNSAATPQNNSKIRDLSYLQQVKEPHTAVRGGYSEPGSYLDSCSLLLDFQSYSSSRTSHLDS